MTQVLQCRYKSWPCDDLDLFYGKVNLGNIDFYMGKIENFGLFLKTIAA